MADKRKNLGHEDPDEDFQILMVRPFGQMGDLPPDPGYTQEPNEDIKRRRPAARMNEPKDSGDIKEGLSFRSRMAGQMQDPDYEDW